MANLNERLFISLPLDQNFIDKDSSEPLANGTIEFFRDSSRNTAKAVYQLSGTEPDYTYTALPNPIVLSAVGNIVNASNVNKTLYFFPYTGTPENPGSEIDLYYIVCKNSAGVEQWTREGWPNISSGNDPTQDPFPVQNQISNSQFTRVFINDGLTTTYTVSGATDQVFEFAPDWNFLISGTGTVQVSRTAVTGLSREVTNPPYYITVTVSTGITACKLTQRMNVNSGLWTSTDTETVYLAGSLIAEATTSEHGISMFYEESSGNAAEQIFTATVEVDVFKNYSGTSDAIPMSANTNSGTSGYIDIYISFATDSITKISSVQLVPTLNEGGGDNLQYDPNSSNREQALMGDYYIPRLEAKPLNSLLQGWDFRLNPAQRAVTGNITNTAAYSWDQTIGHKTTAGNLAYARNTISQGFQLTTPDTSQSFYLLQYLTGADAKKIIQNRWSMNLQAYKTAGAGAVTARLYLFRGSSAASIPTLGTTIGSADASGVFTLGGAGSTNWTEILRSGLGTATCTLNLISANTEIPTQNFGFNGWEITSASEIGDTDKIACVVSFGYTSTSTVIVIDSISLVPGDIPTRPAIKSASETLLELQKYYAKSFLIGTTPAQNAGLDGAAFYTQVSGAAQASATLGIVNFPVEMRATPTVGTYNPQAANGEVRDLAIAGDCSLVTTTNKTARQFVIQGTTNAGSVAGNLLAVHWSAEAGLGVV